MKQIFHRARVKAEPGECPCWVQGSLRKIRIMFGYIALFIGGVYLLRRYLRTLMISDYGRRYVFATGCDTGFGFLAAQKLDIRGFNVFAGCCSEKGADEVRKSCSKRVQTINLDVTNRESIKKALDCVKEALPGSTVSDAFRMFEDRFSSKATFLVPDAYVDALTSSFPKYRYLVGTDANTVFRFMWTVPE